MSDHPPQRPGTNRFVEALGRGRGVELRPNGVSPPLSRRERVQAFADWIESQAERTDRLERLRDENRKAAELGLQLEHGVWKPMSAGDSYSALALCSMLTFVYDDDYCLGCIGIIEVRSTGEATLLLRC